MKSNDGSILREWISNSQGKKFKSYKDLKSAKTDPDSYVVMQGDWGGQIYLTCPIKCVTCDEYMLKKVLRKLDGMCWGCNAGAGADLCYETHRSGDVVPGGMGGGLATDGLWIHPNILNEGNIKAELESIILGKK